MKRLVLVAALLCAATAPAAYATDPWPSRVQPDSLGINAQFLTHTPPHFPQPSAEGQALSTVVGKLAAAGVQVVRVGVSWDKIEPNPPHWLTGQRTVYWTGIEAIAGVLANAGIRMVPTITTTPDWARQIPYASDNVALHMPPANDSQFQWFVNAFAKRFGVNGSYWTSHTGTDMPVSTYEIWNEPNIHGTFTHVTGMCNAVYGAPSNQPGPQRYATLFAAARTGIKSWDTSAIVMIGGLTSKMDVEEGNCTVEQFWAGVKANLGVVTPDAVAIHTYQGEDAGGTYNAPTALQVLYRIRHVRDILDHSVGWTSMPLYFNETGWIVRDPEGLNPSPPPIVSPWVSETQRGLRMAEVADKIIRSDCGVQQFVPHTWRSAEVLTGDTDDDHEDYFGIAQADGDLHPSGVTWSDKIRQLQGKIAAQQPNQDYVQLCSWRAAPDIDNNGVTDTLGEVIPAP